MPDTAPPPDKIAFFGHHKCGSRFFRNTLLKPLAEANSYDIVRYDIRSAPFHFVEAHQLDLQNLDFARFGSGGRRLLSLANTGAETVDRAFAAAPDLKGLHVVRDPRQVLVSGYFHHREGHAVENELGWVWDGLKQARPHLQALPLEEGLLYEMDHVGGDVLDNQLAAWRPHPAVLDLKLEDFDGADGYDHPAVSAVIEHLGFETRPPLRFSKIFSDSGAPHWRELFTPRVKGAFKERWGGLTVRLGYETDDDW